MTLGGQIINLLGSDLSDKATQRAEICHVAVVQMQLVNVLVLCISSGERQFCTQRRRSRRAT